VFLVFKPESAQTFFTGGKGDPAQWTVDGMCAAIFHHVIFGESFQPV
jgi:hypothetical protein